MVDTMLAQRWALARWFNGMANQVESEVREALGITSGPVSDARLPLAVLAQVAGAIESGIHPQSWRHCGIDGTERVDRSAIVGLIVGLARKWRRPVFAPKGETGLPPASTMRAPGGIRTRNLLIRSQMLYPLSYGRSGPRPDEYRAPGRTRRLGDLNPGWAMNPNRISSAAP